MSEWDGTLGGDGHVIIRPARREEFGALAELRWLWSLETGTAPVTDRDDFIRAFVAWAARHADSHHCTVLLRDEAPIGMAWLATVPRVPHVGSLERLSGDVQCVYVVPGERSRGLGGRLIDAVLARARDLGLERVTVHSSDRAVTAYRRHGFGASARLLQVPAGEHD